MAPFEIHGHRGCRGHFPENSLPALEYAIALGVDAIELDIVVSKDKKLIINHDYWIRHRQFISSTGKDLRYRSQNIFEMGSADLVEFINGTVRNPKFKEQHQLETLIPTLEEVVAILGIRDTFYYNIEIKSNKRWYGKGQPFPDEYAQLIIDFIKKNKLTAYCLVQSFDKKLLNEIFKIAPEIRLGLLIERSKNHLKNLSKLKFVPDCYNPFYQLVTGKMVRELHEQNIRIIPWTVNDLKDAHRLFKKGVDGIITDYPKQMIARFHSKKE